MRGLYGSIGGLVIEYPIPTASSGAVNIKLAPDGNMWFSESRGAIGKVTPQGVITEYAAAGVPEGIAIGSDGNVYVTEWTGNNIGKLTPAGVYVSFPLVNSYAHPLSIVKGPGPEPSLWFTEMDGHYVAKFDPKNWPYRPVGIGRQSLRYHARSGRKSLVHRSQR